MKDKPIGVFDSGVGGLTCVKELLQLLPNEDIIYFGDTLRMPYGVNTKEVIAKYTIDDVHFLQKKNVKLIAAACGTVSSNVPAKQITNLKVPFVDVIAPTVNAALKASKTKRIGIIGTPATIKSGSFSNRIKLSDKTAETVSVSCPEFVTLIEEGYISSDNFITTSVAKEYLSSIKDFDVDTLILGCTHFPIISKIIQNIMGDNVTLIDAGYETALEVERILHLNNLQNEKTTKGDIQYYVTAKTENFDNVAKIFLNNQAEARSILAHIKD